MALVRDAVCSRCGICFHNIIPVGSSPGAEPVCYDCQDTEAAAIKQAHFDMLNDLSLDARVRRIENWIYDYKPALNPWDMKF